MTHRIIIALLFCAAFAHGIGYQHGTFRSQATQGEPWTGTASIVEEDFRITVHPTHLDVEMEWVMNVGGRKPSAYSDALEIVGNLNLERGSIVIGMLLWYKDMVLKAKLKRASTAREEYEQVVDRNAEVPPRPRDPVILEYRGNDNYDISIFPVSWGDTRRLRMRYIVPAEINDGAARMGFPHAFTGDARATMVAGPGIDGFSLTGRSDVDQGVITDSVKLGGRQLQPYSTGGRITSIVARPESPNTVPNAQRATTFTVGQLTTHAMQGEIAHLTDFAVQKVLALAGDALPLFVDTSDHRATLGVYAFVSNTNESCSTGVTCSFRSLPILQANARWEKGLYVHSTSPLARKVTWKVFYNGEPIFVYNESPDLVPMADPMMQARIAASSDRLLTLDKTHPQSLGAALGYVDREFALLALEEDVLPCYLAHRYETGGVPTLNAEDIFAESTDLTRVKADNLYQENSYLSQAVAVSDHLKVGMKLNTGIRFEVMGDKIVFHLDPRHLGQAARAQIAIYTPAGRLIRAWRGAELAGKTRLQWSWKRSGLPAGALVVRTRVGSRCVSKTLTVR